MLYICQEPTQFLQSQPQAQMPASNLTTAIWHLQTAMTFKVPDSRKCLSPPVVPPSANSIYEEVLILLSQNRQVDVIIGDGNCLFRALSKALYGVETGHFVLWGFLVSFILKNQGSLWPNVKRGYIWNTSRALCCYLILSGFNFQAQCHKQVGLDQVQTCIQPTKLDFSDTRRISLSPPHFWFETLKRLSLR